MNAGRDPRRLLLDAYRAALDAVGGRESVRRRLARKGALAPRYVLAVGKAAAAMTAGAFDALGAEILRALVVTKYGHAAGFLDPSWPVDVVEASHPIPDESSLAAGRALIDFADAIPVDSDVLALASGGASALVEVLPEGFDASDLARVNEYLLAEGYPIGAMNRVRKRISRIKAGRFARHVAPRHVLNLAVSDVPGDDPKVIGSGLLVAHSSEDIAVDDLALPPWLVEMGERAPPLAGEEATNRIRTEVVARPADARAAVISVLRSAGLDIVEYPELLQGNAVEIGRRIGHETATAGPSAWVWASETTVTLPPNPGRGGRCQSLALAAALEIHECAGTYVLAVGTDGTDGPGEDAGALVDAGTVARGVAIGLDPEVSLRAADAGTFLEASGDLVHTGPTGTNVMDLVVALRAGQG